MCVCVCEVCCTLTPALQCGGDLPGLGDLRLVERLSVLILGGDKREVCVCLICAFMWY